MSETNHGYCPNCGQPLTGSAFCGNCGTQVSGAPVQAAAPKQASANSRPLVPLILLGVAALYSFIALFVHTYSFFSFLSKFWNSAPIAAMIVGLILFHKKEKNLFFAISYFALAASAFVSCFNYMAYSRVGLSIFTFLFYSMICVASAGVGLTYLLAKPKFATLKTLCLCVCAGVTFLVGIIICCVFRGGFLSFLLNFLFCSLPMYAAAVLYTPYQK